MTIQRMIELLEIEHECMLRGSHDDCDRNCADCELVQDDGDLHEMYTNVIALLKEQEPVKPHYNSRTNWYECGACHYSMTSGMHCRSELIPATKVRYCANCGFPVNWEGR